MNNANLIENISYKEPNQSSAERIIDNINFLMKINSIRNRTELANLLHIKAQTLYSFLANPTSASSVKQKICDYFVISLDELENKRLSDIYKDEEELFENNVPISGDSASIASMTGDEVAQFLESASPNPQIDKLKSKLRKSYLPCFNSFITLARRDYATGNHKKALGSVCAAFYMLTPQDIKLISKGDLVLYISLVKKFPDKDYAENLISKLVNTFISDEFYNENILTVLGSLLEKDFTTNSQICYETIVNKNNL